MIKGNKKERDENVRQERDRELDAGKRETKERVERGKNEREERDRE